VRNAPHGSRISPKRVRMSQELPETELFGGWLRKQRRLLDLTQQELADEVGCARVTLRRIEAGTLRPSRELAKVLLECFGIPGGQQEDWIRFARGLAPMPGVGAPLEASVRTSNLPVSPTSFIGRDKEKNEIAFLSERSPLVTILGAAGIGKTRLSLQVAQSQAASYPEGAWLIELAPIRDPLLLPRIVATAIGLRDEPQRPVIDMLCDYLHGKRLLIVLDNCEHLVDACAKLADRILSTAPSVRILASSREALNIPGEVTYLIPPLEIPEIDMVSSLDSACQVEAVRLFIDRAAAALPSFHASDENIASIVRICRHLDGIPLALELAAAKVRVLSVEQLAERLEDRFRLLTGGSRTSLERHQTLRAAIDWSYNLLSPDEQTLFRRLSIFFGGWSLPAAESVCSGDEPEGVLELLEQLINKSLVFAERKQGEDRYQMLETIRQYAFEKLVQHDEDQVLHDRHFKYFLHLAEQAAPHLVRDEQLSWLKHLDRDYENLRAALEWALTGESAGPALRLCAALGRFWLIRCYWREGAAWLDRSLDQAANHADPRERAARIRAFYVDADLADHLGNLLRMEVSAKTSLNLCNPQTDRLDAAIAAFYVGLVHQGLEENEKALRFFEDSLAEFQNLGDAYWEACAFRSLTYILVQRGEMSRIERDRQALLLARHAGERLHLAKVLFNQATWALTSNQIEAAEANLQECERLYDELGYKTGKVSYYHAVIAHLNREYEQAKIMYAKVRDQSDFLGDQDRRSLAITNLGIIAREENDLARAHSYFEQALKVAEAIGSKHDIGYRLALLAEVEYLQGNVNDARENLRKSLWIAGELNDRRYTIGNTLLIFSRVFIDLAPNTAVQVFGAAHAHVQKVDEPLDRFFLHDSDRVIDQARKVLGNQAFQAAFLEGQKMLLDDALQLAFTTLAEM
jgi:predicted ATPase/DNA-binding XRE family transcriptional regulator/tetratricopeptide (TPR) repeat protein